MAKKKLKSQTKTPTKKTTECKVSETRIRKGKIQRTLRTLQQAVIKTKCKINSDTTSGRTVHQAGNEEHAFSNKDLVRSNANSRDENVARNNKCTQFLEAPRNLFEPSRESASEFANWRESELRFAHATTLVKSAASCTSAMSVERLQLITRKCRTRDKTEDVRADVRDERSKSPVREDLSTDNSTDFLNISGLSSITPTNSQNMINATYSPKDNLECLTQQNWNDYVSEGERNFSTKSCIISETVKSPDMFDKNADVLMSPDMFASSDNECGLIDKFPFDSSVKNLVITERAKFPNSATSFWKSAGSSFALTPPASVNSANFSLSDVCNDDLEFRDLKTENDSAYSTSNIVDVLQTQCSPSILSQTFWKRSSNVKIDQMQVAASTSFRKDSSIASANLSDVCNDDLEFRDLETENDSAYSTSNIVDVLQTQCGPSILSQTFWKKNSNIKIDQMQMATSTGFRRDSSTTSANLSDVCNDDLEFRDLENDSAHSTSNVVGVLQTQCSPSILSQTFWKKNNVKIDRMHMAASTGFRKDSTITSANLSDVCNDDLEFRDLETENDSAHSTSNIVDVLQTHCSPSILSQTFWKKNNVKIDRMHMTASTGFRKDSTITSANLSDVCNDDLEFRDLETENDSAYSTSNIVDVLQTHCSPSILSKTSWERSSNVKTDQMQMVDSTSKDSSIFELKGFDTQDIDMRTSAVDTLDVATTKNERVIKNKRINSGHSYNLRVREEINYNEHFFSSRCNFASCRNKENSEQKKGDRNKEKQVISLDNSRLNLTLNSLERLFFESLGIILSMLRDERTAEEYAARRHWRDTLESEAVAAVLSISDIFRTERKPDVCGRQIVTAITSTVDEMVTHVQQNKTLTWIYRIQIILELCVSLPICVKVIDHLITKLTWFQSMRDASEIYRNTETTGNNLRLVLYALDVALRKYRTIVPSVEKSRPARNAIPHVTDLWKIRYAEQKLENAEELNLDVVEKQWLNALSNFVGALRNRFISEPISYSLYLPATSILTGYFA